MAGGGLQSHSHHENDGRRDSWECEGRRTANMWPHERGQQRLAGGVACSMREDRGSQARLWEIIVYLRCI